MYNYKPFLEIGIRISFPINNDMRKYILSINRTFKGVFYKTVWINLTSVKIYLLLILFFCFTLNFVNLDFLILWYYVVENTLRWFRLYKSFLFDSIIILVTDYTLQSTSFTTSFSSIIFTLTFSYFVYLFYLFRFSKTKILQFFDF